MADTVEKSIFYALLEAARGLVLPTGVQKVEPGQSYTPTATSKFVSIEIHFNTSIETDLSLEMDPIRQGFMRTNVMWPKTSSVIDAYDVCGTVRAAFKRGTKLYRSGIQVRIDEDPAISVLDTGDTHHTIPVTIRWMSYPQVPA